MPVTARWVLAYHQIPVSLVRAAGDLLERRMSTPMRTRTNRFTPLSLRDPRKPGQNAVYSRDNLRLLRRSLANHCTHRDPFSSRSSCPHISSLGGKSPL